MNRGPRNLPASIHQRLLNRARAGNVPFNELLQYYVLERFLYRLSRSPYNERLILKGGLMFAFWQAPMSRPTRDVDLLDTGRPSTTEIVDIIRTICDVSVPDDGMRFDIETLVAQAIRAQGVYDGMRVRLTAYLGQANVPVQMDIAFGDVITPGPVRFEFPTVLDSPAPHLLGYSRESVVAEKLHILVRWGTLSSRMKDYYDLWLLSQTFDFDGVTLAKAIQNTFQRRRTAMPATLAVFTDAYKEAAQVQTQWRAFLRTSRLDTASASFAETATAIEHFVAPVLAGLAQDGHFGQTWPPEGPWR